MVTMTKPSYRYLRGLVRGNGLYALRWMQPEQAAVFSALYDYSKPDVLADRAYYQQGNDPITSFRLTCKKELAF